MQSGKFLLRASRVLLAFAALGAAGGAAAQSADRAGAWESRLGLTFSESWDAHDDIGSAVDVNNATGFTFSVGKHLSDRLYLGGSFEFDSPSYDATIVPDDSELPSFGIEGEAENLRLMMDATYNFMDGNFSPFLSGIIGWTWTDTNVGSEPPQTGCWWDPWWGYVCTTWQDTRTTDSFTYGVALGARFDFSEYMAVHASYRLLWADMGKAIGSPEQGAFLVTFGWKF